MNTTTLERPPLTWITGTVHQISPAPAANRSGKIRTDSGQILSAFADKLQLVEEGGTYAFGCVVTTKAGVNYHDVKAVRAVEAPPQRGTSTSAPRQPSAGTGSRTVSSEPPYQDHPPRQSAPQSNGNGNGFYRPTHPRDARRMFLCAQISAAITSRQVQLTADALTDLITELSAAYDATIGRDDQE